MKIKKIAALSMAFLLSSGVFVCNSVSAVVDDGFVPTISVPEETKEEYIECGFTDATAAPGDITYLDLVMTGNTGCAAFMVFTQFDSDIIGIESVSAAHEFADNFDMCNKADRSAVQLLQKDCDNFYTTDEVVLRFAVKIADDAPEGDYPITLMADRCEACAGRINEDGVKEFYMMGFKTTAGTLTISKDKEPKTNIKPMSLGRVYAADDTTEIIRKTGDTTKDGNIKTDDAAKLNNYFVGKETNIENADVNEDGKVDAADYVLMKNYFVEPQKD